jgi:hypothetical protein
MMERMRWAHAVRPYETIQAHKVLDSLTGIATLNVKRMSMGVFSEEIIYACLE